jgi:Calx-beta domain
VVVQYSTRDGQAVGGNSSEKSCDYQTSSGMLEFEPGVPSQNITIKIFEDDLPENEEEFFVDLHEMPGCPVSFLKDSVRCHVILHVLFGSCSLIALAQCPLGRQFKEEGIA